MVDHEKVDEIQLEDTCYHASESEVGWMRMFKDGKIGNMGLNEGFERIYTFTDLQMCFFVIAFHPNRAFSRL